MNHENDNKADTPSWQARQQRLPLAWDNDASQGERSTHRRREPNDSQRDTVEAEPSASGEGPYGKSDSTPVPPESRYTPQSPPQGSTIGEVLTAARRKCEANKSDVAKVTGIPAQVVDNLENERFSKLPPLLYAKSYVSKLCRHYGIDPDPLLDQLSDHSRNMQGSGYIGKFYLSRDQNSSAPKIQYHLAAQDEPGRRPWLSATPSMLAAIIAGALLIILISTVFTLQHFQQSPQDQENNGTSPVEQNQQGNKTEAVDLEELIIPHPLPLKELEVPTE